MSQKRRKADSGKAIGETTALRWEPTHVTKPNPRVVPLHTEISLAETMSRIRAFPLSKRFCLMTSQILERGRESKIA